MHLLSYECWPALAVNSFTMPKQKFVCDNSSPYHIYNRCINKDWFSQPMDGVWDIFLNYLWFTTHAYNLKIHAFILMSNHFHMIATAPDANLSEAMRYFLSMTSRELVKSSDRINHTFAHHFGRSRISTDYYYANAYKYLYYNPVKAGIVERVEQYKYSYIGALYNNLIFPVSINDSTFIDAPGETLKWLNTAANNDHLELIKSALKRSEFKYNKKKLQKFKLNNNYRI